MEILGDCGKKFLKSFIFRRRKGVPERRTGFANLAPHVRERKRQSESSARSLPSHPNQRLYLDEVALITGAGLDSSLYARPIPIDQF